MSASKARWLCWSYAVLGCGEPGFVSLGRNEEAALSARVNFSPSVSDAGAEPACRIPASVEAPFMFDYESSCDAGPRAEPACAEGSASVTVATACEGRRVVACPELGVPPREALDAVLSSLLRECGESANQLQVAFVNGCATQFALSENASARATEARACIAGRLGIETYTCARNLECGVGATYLVPTSSATPEWY